MKKYYSKGLIIFVMLTIIFLPKNFEYKNNLQIYNASGIITYKDANSITILDKKGIKTTIKIKNVKDELGTYVNINLLKNNDKQRVLTYEVNKNNSVPQKYLTKSIFSDYTLAAYNKLKTMSLEEKIAQTLIIHYPTNASTIQKKYQFGGYIFFQKDFKNKSKNDVIKMINDVQNASKIPILTAIDEEGGIVSRISSNSKLVSEPFKSSQTLYKEGGFEAIKADVKNKSKILKSLGLNLNLAPVVDVSTNEDDYIYSRSLGQNISLTSTYAQVVIESSKNTGVSYTLKHFPGYSNNVDTHKGTSEDYKSFEEIKRDDIPPFVAGIKAGAEAIMISHNTVMNIDSENPASISKKIHDYLRNDLEFTGIIITDDLNMSALKNIDNLEVKALLAGNNLLITDNYEKSFNAIKNGINSGLISEDTINQLVFKIIAWKYYKHLL